MKIIEVLQDLFRSEKFVRVTKEGVFLHGSHRRLLGKIYRFIFSGEYIYLPTLYKAHRVVNEILEKIADKPAERENKIARLREFRVALQGFSQETNTRLEDLVQRINVAIVKIEQPKGSVDSPSFLCAHECTELLLQKPVPRASALVATLSQYKEDEKKEAGRLVVEQFLDPIIGEASSIMSQKGLREAVYHQALVQIKTPCEVIASCFGRELLVRTMEERGFDKNIQDNFLLPFVQQKLERRETNRGEIIDTINSLYTYIHDIESVSAELLQRNQIRSLVEGKCSELLASFFLQNHSFSTKKILPLRETLAVLSQFYSGENKNAINGWLISLVDGEKIVTEVFKQLQKGVYVGDEFFVDSSFSTPLILSERDRQIVLCWQFYNKLVKYCSEHNIEEPEREASFLLSMFSHDSSSQLFFSHLGLLAGQPLTQSAVLLSDFHKKESVSFVFRDRKPVVEVTRVFSTEDHPDAPGFSVVVTLSQQDETVVTHMETSPCVFTGEGFHIERIHGEYTLQKDSFRSKLWNKMESCELFPFSVEGIRQLIAKIDDDIATSPTATTISLRHLERALLEKVPTKELFCPEGGPSEMLKNKIQSVKAANSMRCDAAYGRSLARHVIGMYRDKGLTLDLLDDWLIKIWRRESSSYDVMKGFFSELREEFPLQREALEAKEKETFMFTTEYPSLVAECSRLSDNQAFMPTLGSVDSPTSSIWHAFIRLMGVLGKCESQYPSRFPQLVENMYFEHVCPLLSLFVKRRTISKEINKELILDVSRYLKEIQRILPAPKQPFLDALFLLLQKEEGSSNFYKQLLFFVGAQIGQEIAQEDPKSFGGILMVKKFREKEAWVLKAVSGENARQIIEGMRMLSGLHYGFALAQHIDRISLQEFRSILERERALAPVRFSQVLRGVLHQFDQRPREKEALNTFCSEYVEWIFKKLDPNFLDRWMNAHWRIFLSAPVSSSMERIVREVLMRICNTWSKENTEAFFDSLALYIDKEAQALSQGAHYSEKIFSYLEFLHGLPIDDRIQERVRKKLGVTME